VTGEGSANGGELRNGHAEGIRAAIGHPAIVEYLKWLGVTALERMPVHQFVQDPHLKERGLSNYWATTPSAFRPEGRPPSQRLSSE
jgi:pullulanase/glycogen debranching enzyme